MGEKSSSFQKTLAIEAFFDECLLFEVSKLFVSYHVLITEVPVRGYMHVLYSFRVDIL